MRVTLLGEVEQTPKLSLPGFFSFFSFFHFFKIFSY